MFEQILLFLTGSVKVSIHGLSAERFLNLCSGNDFELRQLIRCGEAYHVWMSLAEYRRARRLARKSGVKIHILQKKGLPFLMYRNRKRKAWCLGLFLSIVILYGMSLFLWEIEIMGNTYYSKDILMNFLEQEQITHGMVMSDIHCDELEQKIRVNYPQITWVSAEISGTRLEIKIKENTGALQIKDDLQPSDLIADKAGIITEIVTRSGIPLVKAGDFVEKGQILIRGQVPITDDSGEVKGYHAVAADGTIRAQVTVPYTYSRSNQLCEKHAIKNKVIGVDFWSGMNQLTLGQKPLQMGFHYAVTEYNSLTIFNSWCLPIRSTKTTEVTYETRVRRLDAEEMALYAEEAFLDYVNNLAKEDWILLESDRKIIVDTFSFTDSGTLIMDVPMGQSIHSLPETQDFPHQQ